MLTLKTRWTIFLLAALFSLGIPVSTIWNHSKILREGAPVKIRLQPIDPYDPFRGRYIQLRFNLGSANWKKPLASDSPRRYEKAYLSYALAPDGFATARFLHAEPPTDAPYFQVQNVRQTYLKDWSFELPFNRYYLNEKDAPLAEKIARDAIGPEDSSGEASYLIIRNLDGKIAIDSLYLGGIEIEKRLDAARTEQAVQK